jgi:hypothetical protein
MSQPNTGLVQSLQARIVNRAKGLGVESTLLFTRFGLERFLYRLSKSAYSERFVLKGALMMLVWTGESVRATRDADLLGFGETTPEKLEQIFREIAVIRCDPDDGVAFLPETVAATAIRETDQYGGQRVRVEGRLGTVKLSLQFDVGVGDAVYPPPEWLEYPSLLDIPRPMLRTYQAETSIAEKLHAMVDLGESNTRMKDYFDVATLAGIRDFDGAAMGRAIQETFERRNTPIVATPAGLTS